MDRDLTPEEMQLAGRAVADWVAAYLRDLEQLRVTPDVRPGELFDKLAQAQAGDAEPGEILAEFEREILPHVVHWKHPGFMAYFAAGGSAHGVVAESLIAALNNVGLLWKASPALAEVEQAALARLGECLSLPPEWFGIIHTTASEASLHAVIAAREQARERFGAAFDLNKLVIYTSEQAHSSIEKTMMALGQGREACRKVAVDSEYRMRPDALEAAIQEDEAQGLQPIAVCATIGTTSTSSVDPVPAVAGIAERHDLWVHVDAAYAGPCGMLPEMRPHFEGVERAHSYLLNPHKWMFSPMGLTALYTSEPEVFRRAFSLTPDYLRSREDPRAVNFMEYSIPLGRPFRGLKLWWLLRAFGREGYSAILRRHCDWARRLADRIDAHPRFERLAPTPFSLVCFRARPEGLPETELNDFNERLLEAVNRSGEFFVSSTRLDGRVALRAAIGNLSTEARHVDRLWDLLQEQTG